MSIFIAQQITRAHTIHLPATLQEVFPLFSPLAYTLTSLTPQGNTYLDEFTQDYYQVYISSWETAITHYLFHGDMLVHSDA